MTPEQSSMTDTTRHESTSAADEAARRRTTVISAVLLAALAIPSAGAIAVANAEPNSQQPPAAAASSTTSAAAVIAARKPRRDPAGTQGAHARGCQAVGQAVHEDQVRLGATRSTAPWSSCERRSRTGAARRRTAPWRLRHPAVPAAQEDGHGRQGLEDEPADQIEWGLHYIKSTYGTPTAAWAHSQANNWF